QQSGKRRNDELPVRPASPGADSGGVATEIDEIVVVGTRVHRRGAVAADLELEYPTMKGRLIAEDILVYSGPRVRALELYFVAPGGCRERRSDGEYRNNGEH